MANGNEATKVTIIGHVVTNGGSRLEIVVDDRAEYDKSFLKDRKRTPNRVGDQVTVVIDNDECEAFLHNYPDRTDRYPYTFYIGPARILRRFLGKAGLTQEGTKVKLEFIKTDVPYRIRISKA
jgi:hypothetical protein